MAVDIPTFVTQGWVLFLAYFPLGVIGLWRWGVWLIKKSLAVTYRPQTGVGEGRVAVVTPVYNEDPDMFLRALNSWRDNGVDEIIAVIDYTDTKCIGVLLEFKRHFPGAQLMVTKKPGKRPALVDGIQVATTEFVALVDSDTMWGEHVRDYALVPFKNPRIGGVATRQSVLKPVTLAQRLFNAQLNLRYLEEVPFMVALGGTVITCLSGRTAFYRRAAVLPLLPRLLHETFWGKPVISGDDKRLTYLLEGAGWQVAFQSNAQVFTPGMSTLKQFLKQRLRWTRNSWRADLRTLTEGWAWRHPRFVLYLIDRTLQPFAQLLSPIFFMVALALGLWVPALVLLGWWHIGRVIRMWSYLRRAPRELVLVPFFVGFNFYSALTKVYALVTLNRQGWITRWDTNRLPGPPPWLRLASSFVMTGLIVAVLGSVVTVHERSVLAALRAEEQAWPAALLRLDQAPPRAVPTSVFSEAVIIERYVVQPGDTLLSLARRWGTNVGDIVRANAVRLPSADYIEPGLVIDRPSPHHQTVKAEFTSTYQELGPLSITYAADTNTIEVRGRGQQVTLRTIAEKVTAEQLREVAPGEWYLGANLNIKAGVTLVVAAPEVTWLKLKSNSGDQAVTVVVENGQLLVRDTKITSWDEPAGAVDTRLDDGRSYVVAKGNSRFDITKSEVAYLGQEPKLGGPVGTSGVSWHLSNVDQGTSLITGEVVGNRFHHNFDGLYISGGVGMRIADNEVSDSVRYGIDLYDATHDCVVENNNVYRSGRHGVIASQGSTKNDIRHNEVHNNAEHGIIIHQESHGNRLADNTVYGQRDGIVLHHSQNTVVTGNTIYNNERGIRLTASAHNLLAHNEVRESTRYGVYLGGKSDINTVRENTITKNPVGVYLLSVGNVIEKNMVRDSTYGIALHGAAADNRLVDNTIEQTREVGLYVKATTPNFADRNLFRANGVNIR